MAETLVFEGKCVVKSCKWWIFHTKTPPVNTDIFERVIKLSAKSEIRWKISRIYR